MESEGAGGNSNSRSRGAGASTSDQIFAPQEEVRAPIAPKREMLAASSPYHGKRVQNLTPDSLIKSILQYSFRYF